MVAALKPYQEEGLRFLLSALDERPRRRVRILGDKPGLGKTATGSVAAGELLKRTGKGGIILAPADLLSTWKDELRKWGVDAPVFAPKRSADARAPRPGELVILSYDALAALLRKPKAIKRRAEEGGEAFDARHARAARTWATQREAEAALFSDFGFIIADESQKTRRARAERSLSFEKLRLHATRIGAATIVLSGTLIENSPLDLWVELCTLGVEGEVFNRKEGPISHFAAHFGGVYDSFSRRWSFAPVPPEGSIRPLLDRSGLYLGRDLEDIGEVLPPKSYKITICPCPANVISLGDTIARALGAELLEGEEIEDLEMKAQGAGILGELSRCRKETAAAKIPALIRRLDELGESEGPIVVYSEHLEPIKALASREGWALITGAESARKRKEIVDAFQAGSFKGLAVTSAMREGRTLTRSHYMIKVSPSWLSEWERQAEARLWRTSQEHPVTIELLIAEHAIDRAVYRRLLEGATRNAAIWGDPDRP